MAEKQYKNYDERFLKEEVGSSEPIAILTSDVFLYKNSLAMVKLRNREGNFLQTNQDLIDLFLKRPVFDIKKTYSGETAALVTASCVMLDDNELDSKRFSAIFLEASTTADPGASVHRLPYIGLTEPDFDKFFSPA